VVEKDHAVRRGKFEAEGVRESTFFRVEWQAEKARARNACYAVRPAGKTLPVDQDEPDDLTEGKRDDGEIIAAQAEHWKSEQNAPERREDPGKRQANPE